MSAIPIRNIYAMLCYVWEIPLDDGFLRSCGEEVDNIHTLLARLLQHTSEQVLKRGLYRHYMHNEEEMNTVRGKIDISESVRRCSPLRKRLVCTHDLYTTDTLMNQIVKACLHIMSRSEYVEPAIRQDLHVLLPYFEGISDISLRPSVFAGVQYHRNNRRYRMLMGICELIVAELIADEQNGRIKMHRFLTDKAMANIYEKFVLRFFLWHLPKERYAVHTSMIRWRMSEQGYRHAGSMLPRMYPDIVIEDKRNGTQLIIDAKYYTEMLVKSYRSETAKIRSSHLYQIYAYLSNSAFEGEKRGMLLYPVVSYAVKEVFPFSDHPVEIRTLDLNREWGEIARELMGIVEGA